MPPQLCNRQTIPQTDNSDLQREVIRVNKIEGLVRRPNHHELDDEQNKVQINQEIEKCICHKSRYNTHCPHEENIGESHYSPKGKSPRRNTQNDKSKMAKILDGLPMSLGQTQHEQIWHE